MLIEKSLMGLLHHDDPKYKEADHLIEKLVALTITMDERKQLKALLAGRAAQSPAGVKFSAVGAAAHAIG